MGRHGARGEHDVVLVGGGLQNGLIALALRARRPDVRIALVERGPALGGNHTWSFHAGDVPAEARDFVEPLVCARWDGYRVRFPGLERRLRGPYASILGERLDRVVRAALEPAPGCLLRTGVAALRIEAQAVTLADGQVLRAPLVVDARGPEHAPAEEATGYQKFVGQEIRLASPHGLREPWLMDACVTQPGAFRFLYVLPLAADRLLVEDTCFADDPVLDVGAVRTRIAVYLAQQGLRACELLREEKGVLPMPHGPQPARRQGGALQAGYQGGWFHPLTGYSFPPALRLALHVARLGPEAARGPELAQLERAERRQQRFCRLLGRMLFRWYPPDERWRVLAHFHRLPEPCIRRFYALQLSGVDRFRILWGRPPEGLDVRRALAGGPR